MTTGDYEGRVLSSVASRREQMLRVVRRYFEPDAPLRVLDIGCGTGEHLLDLVRVYPQARCVGVDISAANVAIAEGACQRDVGGDRVSFVATDYMQLRGGPFDLILADTSLHLIQTAPPLDVFRKLASELSPGGFLVASLPYACLHNHLIWAVRRVMRRLRCAATDAAILRTARLAYSGRFSEGFLRERVVYMYLLPSCYDGAHLRSMLSTQCGLNLTEVCAMTHVSIAQPRHRLLVLRKRATGDVQHQAHHQGAS